MPDVEELGSPASSMRVCLHRFQCRPTARRRFQAELLHNKYPTSTEVGLVRMDGSAPRRGGSVLRLELALKQSTRAHHNKFRFHRSALQDLVVFAAFAPCSF